MDTHGDAGCYFDRTTTAPPSPVEEEEFQQQRSKPGRPGVIYCRTCRRPITDISERIAIAGSHLHRRSNPTGIEFLFGCYGVAGGCIAAGTLTLEHSWFSGYRWRYALCGGCQTHLGWEFAADTGFFALIVNQLDEGEGDR